MRNTLAYGALGIAFLTLANAAPPANPEPRWLTNYEEAKAEAKRTGKPIFLVFR